jgi:tRNA(Ile)-lysidine synthase TilS/MesJ
MQCTKCGRAAVVFQPYSGLGLCEHHFVADVEAKARRDIRANRWLEPGDHIGVVVPGGPGDSAAAYILKKIIGNRRDIRISAVMVGKNPPGTGMPADSRPCAGLPDLPVISISAADVPAGGHNPGHCPLPEEVARTHGITKLATGWCLDDEADTVLGCLLGGMVGPLAENHHRKAGAMPLITPFVSVPADEMALYAGLHGTDAPDCCYRNERSPFMDDVHVMLSGYTTAHPGTRYALANLGRQLTRAPAAASDGSRPGGRDSLKTSRGVMPDAP